MKLKISLLFLIAPFLLKAQYKHLEKGHIKVSSKTAKEGLLRAQDKSVSLYGFIDTLGQTIIPFKYKYALDFSGSKAIVVTPENKYLYINTDGSQFNKRAYGDLSDFKNGYAIVQEDKYGVIDLNEDYLIEPQYDKIISKTNRYFTIKQKGYFGVVDRQNKTIYPPEYDAIKSNSDSLFFLKKNNLWAIGSLEGQLISDFKYSDVKPSSRASHTTLKDEEGDNRIFVDLQGNIVEDYDFIGDLKDGVMYADKDNLKGYLNEEYEVVIPIKYPWTIHQDGLIIARDSSYKYGMYNTKGEEVKPFNYENIKLVQPNLLFVAENGEGKLFYRNGKPFSDLIFDTEASFNLYKIKKGKFVAMSGGKKGVLDTSANIIIPFEYDFLRIEFNNTLSAKKNDLFGVIDMDGKEIVPFEFDLIINEGGGKLITTKDNKQGFYQDGRKILDPIYDSIREFTHGHIIVKDNEKYGLITEANEIVLDFKYDDMQAPTFGSGVDIVENGLHGYYSFDQMKIIIDPLYDSIDSYYGDLALIIEKDSKKALYNKNKGFILDFEYDKIITRANGIEIQKNGKTGFLSKSGTMILETIYDEIKFSSATSANVLIGEKWEFIEWTYPEK